MIDYKTISCITLLMKKAYQINSVAKSSLRTGTTE